MIDPSIPASGGEKVVRVAEVRVDAGVVFVVGSVVGAKPFSWRLSKQANAAKTSA